MSLPATNPLLESLQYEAWYRGNLTWKFHSAQKLIDKTFKESKSPLFVGNCSRQLGKSFWAVCKAIEQALKKPKSQIRYGAAFHTDLVEFIIPAFEKVMEDCPPAIKGKYKSSGTSYVFPNGSKIKLVGLDKNPNGLRGSTLDLIILDECGFVTKLDYIYKSVIIPATMHRPEARVILISTPPATPAHDFIEYSQKAEVEGGYACFTIYDNPMINEATIERLMKESGGEDSTTFRREYLCEFVTDQDLAIIGSWKDSYVQDIERDEFFQYYHTYVGMDMGVNDFTAVIFGYYDFKRAALVVTDEFTMNGPAINTDILAKTIKAKEEAIWPGKTVFRRVADNNWPILINDFSYLHNLTFIATNKDEKHAMINELKILIDAGRIIVHPRCKQLIGCLKYGVWDNKRKQFARSKVYGHYDHLDALIYLSRNIAQNTNPIPADHGFENHRSWLGNVSKQRVSPNAKTVSQIFGPKKSN